MFGEHVGFMSSEKDQTSQEYNAMVDAEVKRILEESNERVTKLLKQKEKQLRELSRNLFWYDYLDAAEIDTIMKGKQL